MKRLFLVARHEYLRHARRRAFLLATLGLPLLALLGMGVLILLIQRAERPEAALGFVDQSGLLAAFTLALPNDPEATLVPLQPFAHAAAAQAALEAGEIAAYVLIPADYRAHGRVEVIGVEQLSSAGQRSLEAALRQGLVAQAQLTPAQAALAHDPLGQIEALSPDGRSSDPDAFFGRAMVAMLAGLLFMLTVFTSSSYLLQALIEEKENRTMELLATSISAEQLIGGKTLGLGLLGLTIAGVWVVVGSIGWQIGALFFPALHAINLSLGMLLAAALLLPLGYMLFAGIMIAISAMVPTAQEGQQFAGLATIVAILPMIASASFFLNPNGLFATTLSLFPLSAPLAMLMRMVLTSVPLWQLVLSVTFLALAAGGMIWIASRIFRVGMLRYGQRMSLRDLLRASM
ncbi:MAG: ABC transporter permease [Candidatus Viridilinea halotolerans]|uniref:ABC transporter permease n=1 Tax=Candidatus Viridilinea halotolerans TaxID=2491704 RepID=A0A426TQF4_9CHLR|nr:MAG: ABC transporter permease [Candidatus Viridilinea halotolerans]